MSDRLIDERDGYYRPRAEPPEPHGDYCETCDGDGYLDIVDEWGGVVGPQPCPDCDAAYGPQEDA